VAAVFCPNKALVAVFNEKMGKKGSFGGVYIGFCQKIELWGFQKVTFYPVKWPSFLSKSGKIPCFGSKPWVGVRCDFESRSPPLRTSLKMMETNFYKSPLPQPYFI